MRIMYEDSNNNNLSKELENQIPMEYNEEKTLRIIRKQNEIPGESRLARDLTPEKIKILSKGYAINTIKKFQRDGKNILYTVAALFFLLNVYSLEKEEKM